MRDFNSIYDSIKVLTLITRDRCDVIFRLSRYASVLPGSMAELGVYKGGSAMLLAWANPGKRLHAFDTFQGIPNADAIDGHANGDFGDVSAGTIHRLRDLKIQVNVGPFPETGEICRNERFCFVHFDGDTHRSCRDFLAFFWPRMVNGGILLFDDWLNPQCQGVEKAIMEHCQETGACPFQTAKLQVALTVCRGDR
jgi:O-methyltransferase